MRCKLCDTTMEAKYKEELCFKKYIVYVCPECVEEQWEEE